MFREFWTGVTLLFGGLLILNRLELMVKEIASTTVAVHLGCLALELFFILVLSWILKKDWFQKK